MHSVMTFISSLSFSIDAFRLAWRQRWTTLFSRWNDKMLTPAWVRKPFFLRIIATVMGGYFALSPACRSQQVLARANARRATGSEHGVNHVRLWAEKKLREMLLYINDERTVAELRDCARELEDYMQTRFASDTPIILSPLHMTSDVLASVMCGLISARETLVISTHKDDTLGRNEAASLDKMGVNLVRLDPTLTDGSALRRLLRNVKAQTSQLVIFCRCSVGTHSVTDGQANAYL